MLRIAYSLAALAAAVALASPALASDGVIEINHYKALAGGVNGDLALDPPGYPVTITTSGSYRVTGHMPVPNANTDGIVITALRTTIDLNGFEIRGPNQKPTLFTPCSVIGLGVGIRSTQVVHVRNGRVFGMGNNGIELTGPNARVESVAAAQNCGKGIVTGTNATIIDSEATLNSGAGIQTGNVARIRDSVAEANTGEGILATNSSIVSGCIATNNLFRGISVSGGSVVSRSVATGNGATGIFASDGSVVAESAARGNAHSGVALVGGGNTVVHNALTANSLGGIQSQQVDGIGGNTLNANGTPGITAGVALGCNALDGVGSCPP